MIFQGIQASNFKKPNRFVIVHGGLDPLPPPFSRSAQAEHVFRMKKKQSIFGGSFPFKNIPYYVNILILVNVYVDLVIFTRIAGVTVYLAPLDSLPPGGQAVPGYLAPYPGYLNPRGTSCPGRFILTPANTSKNICSLFCYFSVSF